MKAVEAMKVMKQELENVENVSWRSFFEEKHFFFLPRPSAVVLLGFHNSTPLLLQSVEEVHPAEGRNSG